MQCMATASKHLTSAVWHVECGIGCAATRWLYSHGTVTVQSGAAAHQHPGVILRHVCQPLSIVWVCDTAGSVRSCHLCQDQAKDEHLHCCVKVVSVHATPLQRHQLWGAIPYVEPAAIIGEGMHEQGMDTTSHSAFVT